MPLTLTYKSPSIFENFQVVLNINIREVFIEPLVDVIHNHHKGSLFKSVVNF